MGLGIIAVADDETAYVKAGGPLSSADLASHISYVLDEDWDITIDDVTGPLADNFKPIQTDEPNFGYTKNRIWLRINLENTTAETTEWRLYVRENFLQNFDVRVLRENGQIDHLAAHDPKTRFSDRNINFPELVTAIDFAPGEKISLYMTYWSGGSSNAALSFETLESFSQIAVKRSSKYYISYGMMVILIFASLFGLIILRMPVFLAYMSYVIVTLVYLMHQDGVAFQYFWPNLPTFNSYFSLLIGTLFVMATYNFARVFLQTATHHPRFDKLLKFLFWLTPVLIILGSLVDPQQTKRFIFALVFLAISLGIMGGLLAARTRFKQVRFYLFAWFVGGIGAAGLMNLRHIFGVDIAQDTVFDSVRLSIVIDALMMGLSIADHYIQVLRTRQQATDRSLIEAERNLRLNNRLFALEEQYTLATELAASRDQNLKNTVHDIRQPLHALRLNIQNLKDKKLGENTDLKSIDGAFQYVETLIAQQLQSSITGPPPKPPSSLSLSDETELSLHYVLNSVFEMFQPDAFDKGLEFRSVKTSQRVDLDPLILMRILTNLVSNAIKYTQSGKVLMGVRRAGDSLRLEVHDTGAGLTEQQFQMAQQQNVRLHKNQFGVGGDGYGLAIASELAHDHELTLNIDPRRQNGTGVILEIPRKHLP